MSLRRIILLILLPIPVAMIIIAVVQGIPDEGLEMAALIIGVPILVLNMWEWFDPATLNNLLRK